MYESATASGLGPRADQGRFNLEDSSHISTDRNTLEFRLGNSAFSAATCISEPEQKTRLLIVDDSRVVRKMYGMFLDEKYECDEAESFDEAMAAIKRNDYAVVITDVMMPGLSGIELLRKVVNDYPTTEVIVASSIDRPQRALDAIRLGAFDYLIKPCDPDVLAVTVERAIERRELLLGARNYKRELETRNSELLLRKEQLERLQAQMVHNEKMASLGQLSAGVAHEVNNPVGFVHSNLEMLDQLVGDLVQLLETYDQMELPPEFQAAVDQVKQRIDYPLIVDDVRNMIRDCRDGSDRIRAIIQNLRMFSRLDEAEYKATDVHEGIEATLRLCKRFFSGGKIFLLRDYGILPSIRAFSGPLNQVWMNLIINAAQAIGDASGEIRIATSEDDENVFVAVSDTGCGIAVQNLNRIFDPFFTTKPVGEGTGLGLPVSFGIIQSHGGEITVDSKLAEGTTFTVRLPKAFEPDTCTNEKSIVCYSENYLSLN